MDTVVNVLPELDEDAVLPPRPTRVFRPTHVFVSAGGAAGPQSPSVCKKCGDLANRLHVEQVKASTLAASFKEQLKAMQLQRDAFGITSEERRHENNTITGELIKVSCQVEQVEKAGIVVVPTKDFLQEKIIQVRMVLMEPQELCV